MKTAIIVYRDNDLFCRYLPAIENTLQKSGAKIIKRVFPKGMPREQIIKKIEQEGLGTPHCDVLLSDGTCSLERKFSDTFSFNVRIEAKVEVDLDELFNNLSKLAICPDLFDLDMLSFKQYGKSGERDFLALRKFFQGIFSSLREEKYPQRIYVVGNKLPAHYPFEGLSEDQAARELKKALKSSVSCPVEIREESEIEDEKGVWVIRDRHWFPNEHTSARHYHLARVVNMPPESFFHSLEKDLDILSFDTEKVLRDIIGQLI